VVGPAIAPTAGLASGGLALAECLRANDMARVGCLQKCKKDTCE
jgi:hypothetical protein